jgi:hypothetical protein
MNYWPCPLPLLAPPEGRVWQLVWSSESFRYGGRGTPPVETQTGWRIPAEATVVLAAVNDAEPASTSVPKAGLGRNKDAGTSRTTD